MVDLVSTFFQHLAMRFTQENRLSDITWALCETVPEVAHLLGKFVTAQAYQEGNHALVQS